MNSPYTPHHLVTGCSGFVGTALCQKLLAQGEPVIGIDLLKPSFQHANFVFVQGNILDDALLRLQMKTIHIIHHLAAAVPLVRDKEVMWQTNVEGTRRLIQAALTAPHLKKFVYCSSSAVLAGNSIVSASSKPMPIEDYGQSKAQAEELVCAAFEKNHIPYCILRPRTIIGPGRLGIFSLLFDWIHKDMPVYLIGSGANPMQFIHIDDYVENHLKAMRVEGPCLVNLGSDRYMTLRQLLEGLILHAKSQSRIVSINPSVAKFFLSLLYHLRLSPFTPWHYRAYGESFYFDSSSQLDWVTYRYSTLEVLTDAYDWYFDSRIRQTRGDASVHQRALGQKIFRLLNLLDRSRKLK